MNGARALRLAQRHNLDPDGWGCAILAANSETVKLDAAPGLACASGGVNCETGWVAGSDLADF
jgi:hypothetical protein